MQKKTICLFEDESAKWFGPLIYTRPVWELRIGAYTFLEKLQNIFPEHEFIYICRSQITKTYGESSGLTAFNKFIKSDDLLFINGRVVLNQTCAHQLCNERDESSFLVGDELAAFYIKTKYFDQVRLDENGYLYIDNLSHLQTRQIDANLHRYPWDLVNDAGKEICGDINLDKHSNPDTNIKIPSYVTVLNSANIYSDGNVNFRPGVILNCEKNEIRLGNNTQIGTGAILDSSKGPIWIDEDANVQSGAIIEGPVYVGKKSIIRPGARISDGVCLGPQCRVGGEVSNTIMLGYSNKQHSGYLGSSYIGEWVNFGAATDNSDLKNNYRPVEVMIEGEKVDSEDLHVGSIIADHCKTAIHTRLNTGTVVGVCCNLFGSDFPAKYIPSFTWFGSENYVEYNVKKALETIAVVMERRDMRLTPAMSELLKGIFSSTEHERIELFD
ncbi:MAG: hypothetical protein HN590_05760 [Calditrichaeota bacterium]|nr:hypothetical protein [Calditrichota bacterium]